MAWEWKDGEEHVEAYVADGLHCPGCEAIQTEENRRQDLPQTPGTRVVLYRKDDR